VWSTSTAGMIDKGDNATTSASGISSVSIAVKVASMLLPDRQSTGPKGARA
jgi:hypothetical protein